MLARRRAIDRHVVVTVLTLIVCFVWLVMFCLRIFAHVSIEGAPTMDAAMLLVLGYWFSSNAMKENDK